MKKFLLQIFIFSFLLLISFYWVFSNVDGYSDPYYLRFTTPKQCSLILGISKAAQGLHPKIFNNVLDRTDFFNYSYTISSSPYGRTYLTSIKNKLKENTKDGIFILTVDAWNICSNSKNPNDSLNFSELNTFLSNEVVNTNPNIPYLLNYYDKKFIDIFKSEPKNFLLHNDGWLEVTIPVDSVTVRKRIDRNVDFYKKNYVPNWKFSSVRFKYLEKTIEFLKQHGDVYLVRLPVHKKILELENILVPNIDDKIDSLSSIQNISYLNFSASSNNYIYTDGLHLWKESGAKISKEIATHILNDKKFVSIKD